MEFKYVLIITFIIWAGVSGCQQDDTSAGQTDSENLDNPVLFTINEPGVEVEFSKIGDFIKGSAEGPRLFQRSGDIRYILKELYHPHPVNFENSFDAEDHYKIHIEWSAEQNADSVRKQTQQKVEEELGYSTTRDMTEQMRYNLSVVDETKLKKAPEALTSKGVKSRIEQSGSDWDIMATLPKLAEVLSEQLDAKVDVEQTETEPYNFKLQGMNAGDLKEQLKNKYGVLLQGIREPVERVNITF